MAEPQSILAADFGSVHTRVLLFDLVGGGYRIVARAEVRTTSGFPAGDVMLGLRRAVDRVSKVTNRKLLDENGRIITPESSNGAGIDIFVATASGGRPLRAVLIGLMPGVSVESGVRATEGTYVNIEEVISLGQSRDEEDQLNAILVTNPDLILVTGGTEGGAVAPLEKMLTLVKTSLSTMRDNERPLMLYAGNSELAEKVGDEFGALTTVFIADNVRPTLRDEDLNSVQLQLSRVFDRYKEAQGGGFDEVADMSTTGLFPTARSYSVVAEYLGKARERDVNGVAVVDVGSATATLATYADGAVKTSIRTDIGMGISAPSLLESVDVEAIRRWIPYPIAQADLMNYALNKRLRPNSIPLTRKHLYIEHALLRAGIQDMLNIQRPDWRADPADIDLVIGSGGTLCNTGNPGMTAMLLLDSIQPSGMTELYADPNGVLTAMGALAYAKPEAVVQLLAGGSLEYLGTAFSVGGSPNVRRTAVSYKVEYDDGTADEGKIDGGEFIVLPLATGRTATVKVSAKGGLRLGNRRNINQKVKGGTAGIVIDTRGRPVPLGLALQRRMLQMMLWYSRASGVYHEEIPEEDLEAVEERSVITAGEPAAPEEPPRRGRRRGKQEAAVQEADDATIQEILAESDIDESDLDIFESDEEDVFDDLLR